jgi:site-specific DNA recombinase
VPRKVWDKVQAQLTANVGKRRQHTAERASSLLTGLLVDVAGNRFTPSFTVKNGRRYHYYISQLAIRNPGSKKSLGPIRIPAHEVERRVTEKLCSFLQSDAEVFDKLTALGETPETVRPLVASAKKLARRLPSSRPAELRNILALILKRVIVHQDRLDAVISRHALRRVLNADDVSNLSPKEAPRDSIDENALIRLTIAARLKRFGGEVHLVVPPNSSTGVARQPKPSLVKAVARAHSWYQRVLDRKAFDQRSLARHAGLTERYVGKVFGCAFLAPDIIDAILEGNQPYDLTFEKLCEHIPWSWAEQRAQFGFPPLPSR